MSWGMEDPARRAREDLALQHDPAWDPPRRRRPREGLLVIVFIVLAAAAIWFTLQHEDDAAAEADRMDAVARGVVGLTGRSLARPANLAPVIASMRAQADADDRLAALRVAPARVSAIMIAGDGDGYTLDAGPDGRVTRHDSGPRLPGERYASRLDDLHPADVRRAVLGVARRSGLPPSALDHLVVSHPGRGQSIFVRFDAPTARDRDWTGAGDGSSMRRRAPDAPGPAAGTGAIPRAVGSIVACVEAAGTDGDAIARCLR